MLPDISVNKDCYSHEVTMCFPCSVVSNSLQSGGVCQAPLSKGFIFQSRILGCVAIPFSRGYSQPQDGISVSCIPGGFFTVWATSEAQKNRIVALNSCGAYQRSSFNEPRLLKKLTDKAREFQKNIYFCFIDYANAFVYVDHNKLENSSREETARPPYLSPEKSVCRLRSRS